METYNVIEISTGVVMLSNSTYDECVEWIDNYGDIIDYTIVQY
jgi:phosphosulfolactate synthase (CoM biosynthesis protein A)